MIWAGGVFVRWRFPVSTVTLPVARRPSPIHRQDVARPGLGVKMQLDTASVKLMQHVLDSPLDHGMVRAVAGYKFLYNGPQGGE